VGDCWIGLSLADSSGLILAARVGKHTDELIDQRWLAQKAKQLASDGTVMTGEGMNGYYPLKFFTTSARIRPNDWSAPMVSSGNRLEDGIVGRISLANYGIRRK